MASLHSGGLSGSERAYQQDVLCLDRAPSCPRGYLWEPCVLRLPPSSTAQSIPIVIRLLLKRNILWLIKAQSWGWAESGKSLGNWTNSGLICVTQGVIYRLGPWASPPSSWSFSFSSTKWRYTPTFLGGPLPLNAVICKQASSEILVLLSLLSIHFKVWVLYCSSTLASPLHQDNFPNFFIKMEGSRIYSAEDHRPQLPSPG